MDIGNMHKNICSCNFQVMSVDRQTDILITIICTHSGDKVITVIKNLLSAKQKIQLPNVSFASVAFAFNDFRCHVVRRASHCVRGRSRHDCVQSLCCAEICQLDVSVVITENVSTCRSATQKFTGFNNY